MVMVVVTAIDFQLHVLTLHLVGSAFCIIFVRTRDIPTSMGVVGRGAMATGGIYSIIK